MAETLRDIASQLTRSIDLGEVVALERLSGGRNNRVFHLTTSAGRALLLKHYHRDPLDPRDRLAAEFSFSSFAWSHGVRAIPEPLVSDDLFGMALFEWIAGSPVTADPATVDAALNFFAALNAHRQEAGWLPFAAEACFSVGDHLDTIEARLQRLRRNLPDDQPGAAARELVEGRLRAAWDVARQQAEPLIDEAHLGGRERCLSPSDFGFHNALQSPQRGLVFFDFEYGGWDDPAKLVCDFFCQVAVPVPVELLPPFIDRVMRELHLPERHRRRIELLMPVYRVKWCCIVLNEFLPEGARRREFAADADGEDDRRRVQLAKAVRLLDGLR